jgi:hypothetical protein
MLVMRRSVGSFFMHQCGWLLARASTDLLVGAPLAPLRADLTAPTSPRPLAAGSMKNFFKDGQREDPRARQGLPRPHSVPDAELIGPLPL